jgi:hypothetical protein
MGNLVTKKEGNVGNDVYDIGPITGAPWGIGSKNLFGGARWIWNTPGARTNADINVIIKFSKTFTNDSTVLGSYNIAIDEIGYIDCNGFPIIKNGNYYNTTQCSGGWRNKIKDKFSGVTQNVYILKGQNRVNIYAMNGGGYAGVLANIVVPGKSIQITDASWTSRIVNSYQNVVNLGDVNRSVRKEEFSPLFKSASFIWSDRNSPNNTPDTNTSPNTYVKFSFVFNYKCANGVFENATCNIATNDECYLYMNSELKNEDKVFTVKAPIQIQGLGKNIPITYVQGINFIDIIVKNTKKNASLIGTFFNGAGSLAIVTNSNWTYSIIPIQSSVGNIYERPMISYSKLKNTIMPQCYSDVATKWIWNTTTNAAGTTGINSLITFTHSFNYTGDSSRGYCYIIVDDVCTLYINDKLGVEVKYGGMILEGLDQNTYNEFDLKQGTNNIKIIAKNTGGSAGFAAIFYDNNDNIVAYTNKSWYYSATILPSTDPKVQNNFSKTFKDMNTIEGFTSFKEFKDNFALFNSYKEGFTNLKTWNFENSVDWYKVLKNGYSIKMSETGIKLPTRQYSISFLYHLSRLSPSQNNIFHITNTGNNCCANGDRIPGLWVLPNQTALHLRFSTDAGGDDGMSGVGSIPLNQKVLITLVFDNNTVTMYTDDVITVTQSFQNIRSIESSATLWIGDPWHDNTGAIQIKGFTIYDGVLSSSQVANIYDNLEKGEPGKDGAIGPIGQKGEPGKDAVPGKDGVPGKNGVPGKDSVPSKDGVPGKNGEPGKNGAPGINGSKGDPGKDGINGKQGNPGTAGKDGTPGANGEKGDPGKDGAAGKDGADGQKGDPGIAGAKGDKGDKGTPGSTNSRSALKPGVEINTRIDRIKTANDTYAYCLGGTITCDDSIVDPITDDYKGGTTYNFKCNNDTQAYCLNGIGQMPDRAYISPFPFSNSYRGFTVETDEKSPYVYDLGSNNIMYYSNNQLIASDDICNYLTNRNANDKCNQVNKIANIYK